MNPIHILGPLTCVVEALRWPTRETRSRPILVLSVITVVCCLYLYGAQASDPASIDPDVQRVQREVIDEYLTRLGKDITDENRAQAKETIDRAVAARERELVVEQRARLQQLRRELRQAKSRRDGSKERQILGQIEKLENPTSQLIPVLKAPFKVGQFGQLQHMQLKIEHVDEDADKWVVRQVVGGRPNPEPLVLQGHWGLVNNGRGMVFGRTVVVVGFDEQRDGKKWPILKPLNLTGNYLMNWTREYHPERSEADER